MSNSSSRSSASSTSGPTIQDPRRRAGAIGDARHACAGGAPSSDDRRDRHGAHRARPSRRRRRRRRDATPLLPATSSTCDRPRRRLRVERPLLQRGEHSSRAAIVNGPGHAASRAPSIVAIGCTSRVLDVRNASSTSASALIATSASTIGRSSSSNSSRVMPARQPDCERRRQQLDRRCRRTHSNPCPRTGCRPCWRTGLLPRRGARALSSDDVLRVRCRLQARERARSLRGHGTVTTSAAADQGVAGPHWMTTVAGASPRADPSDRAPPVTVTRTQPAPGWLATTVVSIASRSAVVVVGHCEPEPVRRAVEASEVALHRERGVVDDLHRLEHPVAAPVDTARGLVRGDERRHPTFMHRARRTPSRPAPSTLGRHALAALAHDRQPPVARWRPGSAGAPSTRSRPIRPRGSSPT